MYTTFFDCKNGRRFMNALVNAADGDQNICIMFTDNLKNDVRGLVAKSEFKKAISGGFLWKKSNEGYDIWKGIHDNINEQDPYLEMKHISKVKNRSIKQSGRKMCRICGNSITGTGRHKDCRECSNLIRRIATPGTPYKEAIKRAKELVKEHRAAI